jgi:hypothetical protein
MKRTKLGWIAGALLLAMAVPQSASAIGGAWGFEFAIDAPWRLEPVKDSAGSFIYPPIPITIVFHDTIFEDGRGKIASTGLPKIAVGSIIGIRVFEIGTNAPPVTEIRVKDMEEIEVKRDLSTKSNEPPHLICRPSTGQDCRDLLTISDTHEWHGLFWYRPKTPLTAGSNLRLKVTVETQAVVSVPRPNTLPSKETVAREWTNYLVVHAGEEPLPRFGADWLYGDVHYHSQMTDNEGESAYSYRNVARALGALGMDFMFATDHASNGEQLDGSLDGKMEARDLNKTRFGAAKSILYGPDGVNELIADEARRIGFPRLRSAAILPQVYMGEELDAWPEMSPKEFASGNIRYGDFGLYGGGVIYTWWHGQSRSENGKCSTGVTDMSECQDKYAKPAANTKEAYFVYDEQGAVTSDPEPSRQHVVYFPLDASLSGAGFIGSNTEKFGGASKSIQKIAGEIEGGGFAFLAHPVEDPEPGSKKGPDVIPYSDLALTRAWSSPAILGLEFWNENARYRADRARPDDTVVEQRKTGNNISFTYRWPFPGEFPESGPWKWQQAGPLHRGLMGPTFDKLHHGAAAWDRFLRKGLDPQQTAKLRWLTKGEPRKWFAAGGSDAHGDWNYRRHGRPGVSFWRGIPSGLIRFNDVPVSDTAIGNPRNLVAMSGQPSALPTATIAGAPTSGPKRYSNREVIDALRAGRFSVTDGPAIRIAVDKNRNGKIDDSDFPMGSTFTFLPGEHIPLLVEWFSTPEFGPIDQIDIYVGNSKETFAGKAHGSRVLPILLSQKPQDTQGGGQSGGGGNPPPGPLSEDYGGYTPDPSRTLQIKLADGAGNFNRANVPNSVRYHGVAKIFIGPGQFRLADANGELSYLRAFARTITDQQGQDTGQCPQVGSAGSKCGDRFAFSNPIWAKYEAAICANLPAGSRPGMTARPATPLAPPGPSRLPRQLAPQFTQSPYLDADGDGSADVCQRDIPNPCPLSALGGSQVATDDTRTPNPSLRKPIPNFSCQRVEAPA